MTTPPYVGRFAPSPTGPLHYGSLVAALASYLDARHRGGTWLLRIEDLDPPRESRSAPGEIIRQLTRLGLNWDGEVLYQSNRLDKYEEALDQLLDQGLCYACTCSRKRVSVCTCRSRQQGKYHKDLKMAEPFALRLKLDDNHYTDQCTGHRTGHCTIHDAVFGALSWHLQKEVGDFIVKRKDGLFAYQLAVAVDDNAQKVTHVVRGADLLDSTPKQLAIYQALSFRPPAYTHIPVLTDPQGNKLSKQSHAPAISTADPVQMLNAALTSLGQKNQTEQQPAGLLIQAARCWDVAGIPRQMALPGPVFAPQDQ